MTARKINNPFVNEKRIRSRKGISISEKVECEISIDLLALSGHVISLSPGGCAIVVQSVQLDNMQLQSGTLVRCAFRVSGLEELVSVCTVMNISSWSSEKGKFHRIGVSFVNGDTEGADAERRVSKRFVVSEFMRPMVSFENPIFEYSLIHARISDISADSIRCETSSRNNSLLPGIKVRVSATFPLIGPLQFEGKILYFKPHPYDSARLIFGMKIMSNISEFQNKASELLLMSNSEVTTAELMRENFELGCLSSGVSLQYAFSKEELEEIGQLRLKAWQHKNFFLDATDTQKMFDLFDRYSRHMVARINGKIVASARLVFNDGKKERCEHLSYGAQIPKWLWDAGFVETSRLVTDPDFRGSDLFLLMTQMIGKTVVQSGYRYMVSSCEKSLEKIYCSSGCFKIGSFVTADTGHEWSLLAMDVIDTSKGVRMNPLFWNIVQRPMVEFLIRRKQITLNYFEWSLIKVYRCFGFAARIFLRIKKKKKKKAKK